MVTEDMVQRRPHELEWLKDLRQYAGQYGSEVRFLPNASKINIRITRTKTKAMDARLGELVFPAATDAWSIAPTPEPDIPPDRKEFIEEQLRALATEAGMDPGVVDPQKVREFEVGLAEEAAKAMTVKMRDVFVESRWRHIAPQVYHSGHLYGAGILKGPLVERKSIKHWTRVEGGEFAITKRSVVAPFLEHTPIWDYFPDMTARSLWESDHQSQWHPMPRFKVLQLAARPDFNSSRLRSILASSPDGDAQWQPWEIDMFKIGRFDPSQVAPQPHQRYGLMESWFLSDAADLAREGIELPEEFRGRPIEGYAWWIYNTGQIVKVTINPFDKQTRPFSFYVPDPEEGRLYGNSIPYSVRDTAQLFNASARMMVDNAARAVMPQVEMDKRRIAGNRDPLNMYPGRVWFAEEAIMGNNQPAIRTVEFPLHAATFLQIANVAKSWMDDASAIPSFTHGDRSPGVGRTVGGLSLLMGAANVMLKEPLRAWDECFERFLLLLYDWFMQFDEDPEIKGDFTVNVKGTHSILAKEFKVEKLDSFLGRVSNEFLAPYVDFHELIMEIGEAMELPARIVKTETQVQEEAAQAQAQAQLEAGAEGAGGGGSDQSVNTQGGGAPSDSGGVGPADAGAAPAPSGPDG